MPVVDYNSTYLKLRIAVIDLKGNNYSQIL
jgi:hypothetical protein